jgi:hypothetical protein
METFKIRASASGKMLTNARGKSGDNLSKTSQSYVETWLKEQLYQVKNEIRSKYVLKGLVMENDSIDFAAWHFEKLGESKWTFAVKNEVSYEDEYFTGTPDIVFDDEVIDIKTSWDCFTFPLFDDEINPDYFAQLQVYMHLTGKRRASLVYVLMNTPDEFDASGFDYQGIDSALRVKRISFDYDEQVIKKLHERVILAREYVNQLMNKI